MFGNILRQLRKEKGVTQAELAAVLNLDASSISKYEKADVSPSADVLLKIAQYFDVPTDYLLGLPDKKNSPAPDRASEEELQKLRELVKELSPQQQEELYRYGKYLASQRREE